MSGNSPVVKGTPFLFSHASASGASESSTGIGEIGFGMCSPGDEWPQTDLLRIYYTNMTVGGLAEATAERNSDYVDHHRRISKKQAQYLASLISKMIMEEFSGCFPSDDEIDAILGEGKHV